MSAWWRGRLVWRLLLMGLVQVACVVVFALALPRVVLDPPPRRGAPAPHAGPPRGDPPPGPGQHDDTRRDLLPVLTIAWGLLVVGLGGFLTARWILRPLHQLTEGAEALGAGALGARVHLGRRDELGDVGRAFDVMADRIERLVLAEKELLANVSHELRTPLARVRVALDLAADGDAARAQRSLQEIAVDLAELEDLLDDIMTMRRMEIATRQLAEGGAQGGLALQRQETTPAMICDQAKHKFAARYPQRTLEVRPKIGSDHHIYVDPMLFRRVLDNLLDNAVKYTPDPAAPIVLEVGAAGEAAEFAVIDRGVGIAADDLPNLLLPFFRAERSRTRDAGGVGLGLTLADRIVRAHGGSLRIQSTPHVGTTVRVRLPVSYGAVGERA